MSKKIILSLFLLLVFAFTGIAYAEENPYKGLTQEQIIQKYFEGRQLDPIEGVWDFFGTTIIITKASLLDTTIKDYKDYDYVMVKCSSPQKAEIFGIRKAKIPHSYIYGKWNRVLKQLSPTTLFWLEDWSPNFSWATIITRVYPSELK